MAVQIVATGRGGGLGAWRSLVGWMCIEGLGGTWGAIAVPPLFLQSCPILQAWGWGKCGGDHPSAAGAEAERRRERGLVNKLS